MIDVTDTLNTILFSKGTDEFVISLRTLLFQRLKANALSRANINTFLDETSVLPAVHNLYNEVYIESYLKLGEGVVSNAIASAISVYSYANTVSDEDRRDKTAAALLEHGEGKLQGSVNNNPVLNGMILIKYYTDETNDVLNKMLGGKE